MGMSVGVGGRTLRLTKVREAYTPYPFSVLGTCWVWWDSPRRIEVGNRGFGGAAPVNPSETWNQGSGTTA